MQARGRLRAVDDAEWLRAFVTRLTDRHEASRSAPWTVSDAPEKYIETMLRVIVGIEIVLTSLTGKWKVSQNRSAADRAGVARGLADAGIRFEACSTSLASDPAPAPAPAPVLATDRT